MGLHMFLIFFFGFTFLRTGRARDQVEVSRSNDPARRCHYTFTVPSPVESSCPGDGFKPELDGVVSRLSLLENLVSRLIDGADRGSGEAGKRHESLQEAYGQVTRERDQLQRDKKSLSRKVQELQSALTELSEEAEKLREGPCQPAETSEATPHENRPARDPAYDSRNDVYQEMQAEVTEVPASHLLQEETLNFTGCGDLLSVGEPFLHRKAESIRGKYGVWLQDPDPLGPLYTNKTVWRIDAVGTDVRQLFVYEDMEEFSRGFPMKVLLLPEPVESTGATVYRGSLYYQRRRSRTLLRYDLAAETVTSRSDLPNASFHGQYPYSWGGYTDIDLAVDEQGLWAIYSTDKAKGAIVISQLDPESLKVKESWETKIRKNMVANAFMVCGRLYTVASYTLSNTTINYTFDTATGEGSAIFVPFQNRYHYNSMVDYNYATRKLHAWDNFHMVSYDVRLGRSHHSRS